LKGEKMNNLTLAEKGFARDIYALLIRHKLKLVMCKGDEDIYISNEKEGEKSIFIKFDELAEEVGVKII